MASRMLIGYLGAGALFALLVIGWALKSRQFDDQDRARFLPLRDLSDRERGHPPVRRWTGSLVLALGVILAGLVAVANLLVRLAASPGS